MGTDRSSPAVGLLTGGAAGPGFEILVCPSSSRSRSPNASGSQEWHWHSQRRRFASSAASNHRRSHSRGVTPTSRFAPADAAIRARVDDVLDRQRPNTGSVRIRSPPERARPVSRAHRPQLQLPTAQHYPLLSAPLPRAVSRPEPGQLLRSLFLCVAQDSADAAFRIDRKAGCFRVSTPVLRIAEPRLRLALVLWSGAIGGAETLVVALAGALRASSVDAQVIVLTRAGQLAERLQHAAVPFSELDLKRPRAGLKHPRRLAEAVGRSGSDGAILPGSGFLAPALRLGGYRGRIVAVEHGSILQVDGLLRRSRLIDRFDRLLGIGFVDVHVAVSDFIRDHMRGGSIVTIPNGVDLDQYRPPTASRSKHAFVIGCVSRLAPGKGVEDVLVAAQPAICRGARLRIAGDGPERSKLERLAKQLRVSHGVSFEGWIRDAPAVAAFWRGCEVAITAPNDWVESFGLGAVEAMACGRPVVATRAGGLIEVVAHGRTRLSRRAG